MREFEPALADDQRSSIRETVHNGARQARVVESSPRLFRALRGDATTVPTDELLQGVPEGEHSFPVSQRFVLRVRDDTTIAQITP